MDFAEYMAQPVSLGTALRWMGVRDPSRLSHNDYCRHAEAAVDAQADRWRLVRWWWQDTAAALSPVRAAGYESGSSNENENTNGGEA